MQIHPPEPLNPSHQTNEFDSGNSALNDWLKQRSKKNEDQRGSRTYVVCVDNTVVAYYCLASGGIAHTVATGKVRRNMPDPIPAVVIGRLAVDQRWQGKGIGSGLLRDAVLRTLKASEIVGIRAIFVHAISEEAKQFYEKHGFTASPISPMLLMVKLDDAIASLQPPK